VNCAEIARLAPLYITGELESARAAEFDTHLKTCPACMLELERQSRLDSRLREEILGEETNAFWVDRRVRELISAEAEGQPLPDLPRNRRRWQAMLLATAAAALLAIGGYRALNTHVARVYADAAEDHWTEIVQGQPRHWLTDPAQIAALAAKQGIDSTSLVSLESGPYRLVRGKICFIDHHIFLHLVYSDGSQNFSVFLRQKYANPLPGNVREISNGKPLCTSDLGHEHVASFQTDHLVALVVADQSSDAALHFARFASAVL
jgi:Putative zinc-finger